MKSMYMVHPVTGKEYKLPNCLHDGTFEREFLKDDNCTRIDGVSVIIRNDGVEDDTPPLE